MSAIIAFVLHLTSLDVDHAAILAVKLERGPQLSRADWDVVNGIRRYAWRESRGQRVGIHDRDRGAARTMVVKARRRGWLQRWCPWHRAAWGGSQGDVERLGVRGNFGLSYAYNARYLPVACFPPEWLDVPVVSAWVAARKWIANSTDPRAAWTGAAICRERRAKWGDCRKRKDDA